MKTRSLAALALSMLLPLGLQQSAAQVRPAITAAPNPVTVGGVLVLGTNPTVFVFTPGTVVWVSPLSGVGSGLLTRNVVLCGTPAGAAAIAGGTSAALPPCRPGLGGRTLTVAIPNGPEGDLLLQRGLPPPSGYWNLSAMNTATGAIAVVRGQIHFVATAPVMSPLPKAAPYVTSISPLCVNSFTPQIAVYGQNFDAGGAQAVVSFIYFTDKHGTFRTDFNGRDSRVAATMLSRGPGQLSFQIDLRAIHRTGGDNFGIGGNYYVQVQNPDGKVSGGPIFFTAQPYNGPGGHC